MGAHVHVPVFVHLCVHPCVLALACVPCLAVLGEGCHPQPCPAAPTSQNAWICLA
jgi:hypothetical protein